MHLSNSPGVFGHRAILIWGDRDMAGGFLEEQPVAFILLVFKRLQDCLNRRCFI